VVVQQQTFGLTRTEMYPLDTYDYCWIWCRR